MCRLFGCAAALAVGALLATASPSGAADLTGNMAPFGYLLGAPWNCTTNVPAMGSRPAHSEQGTATFDAVAGNTVHNHVATPDYSGDFYFGYNDKMSMYWQTSADNMGVHAFLTSSDGKTYTGTSSMGPLSMQDTVTYGKLSDNKVTVHEVLTGAVPTATFDSVCTR
jgi:hypothetical protein